MTSCWSLGPVLGAPVRSVNSRLDTIAREGDKETADTLRECKYVYLENDVWTTDLAPMGVHAMLCRGLHADGTMTPNILVGVKDITDKSHKAVQLADNCLQVRVCFGGVPSRYTSKVLC